MSVVLLGSTSGSITLQEPAIAGTTVLDLPNTSGTLVVAGGAQTVQFGAGSATAPSVTFTGDTNTGIFSPGADTIAFTEGGAESMRITSAGNVGIGDGTITAASQLHIYKSLATADISLQSAGASGRRWIFQSNTDGSLAFYDNNAAAERMRIDSGGQIGINTTTPADRFTVNGNIALNGGVNYVFANGGGSGGSLNAGIGLDGTNNRVLFYTGGAGNERMRIDSSGILYFGTTTANPPPNNVYGVTINASTSSGVYAAGVINASANGSAALSINRGTDDGTLVNFYQAGTVEGSITVSGTTVSYNGGHLARWSQLPNNQKDDTLLKGTVMSNLDEMCVWTKDGEVLPNEQLNKMKVSDVDGDINVAGVFVNWDNEDISSPIDMNVAMTGDMIIRIAEGVVVQKGDLLMSAGDGTAKPQGDDIVRSKTIAKVTSNHVTCTYADGSYCVPCVLMAC
jgi:hypothetical protein